MSQEVGWQHCAVPVTKTTPPLSNTSLQSRRWPSVHLHHSENRTSAHPRLLSVRVGRQISAGNAALLYWTVWQCVLLFFEKTITLVCSVIVQAAFAMAPSVVATTECMLTLSRPWLGMDPSFTSSHLRARIQVSGWPFVCAKEPFPSAHSECQAFKPTLPCDACSCGTFVSGAR